MNSDTIAAIATASGKGGVGIVRISGPAALTIGEQLCRIALQPRHAHFCNFLDAEEHVLDQGIALYFQAPASYTGEDIVELQGHGGPVVLDGLLSAALALGARLARPGEFSERAFLNDKIDLVQAEAIADIIESNSAAALRSSMRSLAGEFSNEIHRLVEQVTQLRMYVEAAIDFPDEDIDFVAEDYVADSLNELVQQLNATIAKAKSGAVLNEGLNVAIIGKPNAGKSSLLNALAADDIAIVNEQAGTTRDILKQQISLAGISLTLIDTAGLRSSDDSIEQEGIRRINRATQTADVVLYVNDAFANGFCIERSPIDELIKAHQIDIADDVLMIAINNKIDLLENPQQPVSEQLISLAVSARDNLGLEQLGETLREHYGLNNSNEGSFTARRRHLRQLQLAGEFLLQGQQQLVSQQAGELLAEDLRQVQNALGEITGAVSSDDLLGVIFSSFCIGK